MTRFIATAYHIFSALDGSKLPQPDIDSSIGKALKFVFALAMGIALIMIAVGGFRYTVSRGDPTTVKTAKETIIYAVVGLLVAIGGFGIVTFVFGKVSG